jgi:hypothetical protein
MASIATTTKETIETAVATSADPSILSSAAETEEMVENGAVDLALSRMFRKRPVLIPLLLRLSECRGFPDQLPSQRWEKPFFF